ncbi:hypothetical protein ACFJIX_10745 [Roseateles sp. UC29_93]|uniref:hypothetical protein n=1 Tax=Roseateles sp. UC29_93 TaxID=3350177 RepID=UPI003672230C
MHFIPHPDDAPSPVSDRHIATMATLNLGLPDDLLAYLDEQAFAHGHDDSAQYVVQVLHQHRERQALKSRLINSIKSGPAGFADDQYFNELLEEAEAEALNMTRLRHWRVGHKSPQEVFNVETEDHVRMIDVIHERRDMTQCLSRD